VSAPDSDDPDPMESWPDDVDRTILATLGTTASAMSAAGAGASDLTQAVMRAAEGGKRLRSTILLASHGAHGGEAEHAAVGLAAALELFHTGALLHDDVLDDSDSRRGRPTAHRSFAAHHADRALTGDATAFGRAGAILAGDVALIAGSRALWSALEMLPDGAASTAAEVYFNTVDLVCAGQYLDMWIAAEPLDSLPDQDEAIRGVMRSKTASYTWTAPLMLGAAAAGSGDITRLRGIGESAGTAFQLRDDVLGLTGSPESTGKPVGDDVREGKRTLLVWHAWTKASQTQRSTLRNALGRRDASDGDVAAAIDVVRSTGAFDAVEDEIAHAVAVATERLEDVSLGEPYRTRLLELVSTAANRDR
jgi:geranylgeranyl diphosphate synthase type I